MRYFTSIFLLFLAFLPTIALAKPVEPGALILDVSNHVLDMVEEAKALDNGEDYLQKELLVYLDPHIDFPSFARGVMGKHRKTPTPAQTQNFVHDFKETLVRLYAKAMLAFDVEDIALAGVREPRPEVAQVTMLITSTEGANFQVQYSLRQNGEGRWQVRNVILDGVNLGLTYRNQFYSAVESNKGDVAAAIASWAEVMEDVKTPHTTSTKD